MNKQLQNIASIIQQDESLSAELKSSILKSLKDADKELEIATFKLDRTEKIKRTTAILLEETIAELEQKRKAVEDQNHELAIEAALERIRSRSLGMRKSDELRDVVKLVFEILQELSYGIDGAAFIMTPSEDSESLNTWIGDNHAEYPTCFKIPKFNTPSIQDIWKAVESGVDFISKTYSSEEKNHWFRYAFENTDLRSLPDELKNWILQQEYLTQCFSWANESGLGIHFHHQRTLTDNEIDILKRFSNVFDQAYTRFLDLQKAEAQAREAQIEAALEKVRSRTMAMQHSSELTETSFLLVKQVLALGIKTWGCAFNIFDKDQPSSTEWFSNEQGYKSMYKIPREGVFLRYYEAAQRGESLHVEEFKGQACIDHYLYLSTLPGLEDEMKIYTEHGVPLPTSQYDNVTFFKYGYLLFVTYEHVPEAHDIFKRFAKVFEQTYTRFLDLQKAEAQALEATKRASVDRVRAEIASMRTTKDLERITPLIWKELAILGIPFIRCGVFIMDESLRQIHTFLSTPDGRAIAAFNLPYDIPGRTSEILAAWLNKEVYIEHWDETAFSELGDLLVQQGSLPSKDVYLKTVPKGGLHLHCLPFLQGMLYAGNTIRLKSDEIQLIQSVADAFSTAYARYEDFNKLEAAKRQVDKTLDDLKQAQQQLIQSEKMASLGELTAGIAHEIQNPLNFVNNFSEVSMEMLKEMKEELEEGNLEEVQELVNDVIGNLEKIHRHGNRAAGIVKGMLMHSRADKGVMEATDLNALVDEYLRLAYHGLRAKDKSFNVTLETDYDESIGKVDIVPQDIGRAILNVMINAFHAVNEKKKQMQEAFQPTVSIQTKNSAGHITISITDNGSGIPEAIAGKIFQPFFTTKPTGQGTGLGLSLSYDIMKSHGGKLYFTSQQGKGTAFFIELPA